MIGLLINRVEFGVNIHDKLQIKAITFKITE